MIFLRIQLIEQLKVIGFINEHTYNEFNTFSDNIATIKSAILAGLYPYLLRVDKTNKIFLTE